MLDQARRGGMLRAGQRVGSFRIGWLVGIGATSEIYVASDERRRRDIVLKLISLPSPAHQHLLRLQREVAALEAASHRNVLRVYECGQLQDHAYLITDFAEGGSLEERLQGARPTTEQALQLLRGTADGLDHIHALGIVHGDIKPANVLLTRGARPLIADFGIARLPSQPSDTKNLQQSKHPVGTPLYMSPEQIRNEPLHQAGDVYSFSVLAYQLLCGRVPFRAEVSADVMHMHLTASPPPLSALAPDLPATLDEILARGMAKQPSDRWGRCSELVDGIVAGLAGKAPARAAADADKRGAEAPAVTSASRLVARLFPRQANGRRPRGLRQLQGR